MWINSYYTDHWEAYKKTIPKDKHYLWKDNTFTVEWCNNLLRCWMARFHRKTHCYSKSLDMVKYSILIFMYKHIIQYIYC